MLGRRRWLGCCPHSPIKSAESPHIDASEVVSSRRSAALINSRLHALQSLPTWPICTSRNAANNNKHGTDAHSVEEAWLGRGREVQLSANIKLNDRVHVDGATSVKQSEASSLSIDELLASAVGVRPAACAEQPCQSRLPVWWTTAFDETSYQ